ncbi:MAG: spore germination protein [Clostridia bacterium]|nr:spore germination protein [Clostridia bacterium]
MGMANELQQRINRCLNVDGAFDYKLRPVVIGGKRGILCYLVGYTDALATERCLSALLRITEEEMASLSSMEELLERYLPLASAEVCPTAERAAGEILRGSMSLVLEGFEQILLADVRLFPVRSPNEPEKDRTLRGPHTGLGESMVSSLVQIRRHLRTGDMRTERYLVGKKYPNEVCLLSLEGRADKALLERIRDRLRNAKVAGLAMTQESLANLLFPMKGLRLFNPFPRVRYTERPDVIAAALMEGKVVLLCDNSPSALLLPETVYDFFEQTDDYYFPPLTASYLRCVRFLVFLTSIYLIPIWLLAVRNAARLPSSLSALLADGDYTVPLFLQFLIIEFAIDGLKMASLNTPSTLAGSFSVIGGLLLGEYAVKSGWFLPQTILYSAFTSIANFIPTNYELSYSFKFMRISLILLVEFFGNIGLVAGTVLWLLILASTRTVAEKGYLYPFLPFHPKGIKKIFFRSLHGKEESSE